MSAITSDIIREIVNYCKQHGIESVIIRRGLSNEYYTDTKTININGNHSLRVQAYALFHEYGHHRIIQTPELNKKFEKLIDREAKNTLSEQILALEEEMLAWHFGEELARELGIDLSDRSYQIFKSKCLKSHIVSYTKIVPEEE